jgi:putative transposase
VTQRGNRRQATFFCEADYDAYVGGRDDRLVRVAPLLKRVDDWRAYLGAGASAEDGALLGRHERTGRPLGDARFVARLERRLGRALHKKPAGRPREEPEKQV